MDVTIQYDDQEFVSSGSVEMISGEPRRRKMARCVTDTDGTGSA